MYLSCPLCGAALAAHSDACPVCGSAVIREAGRPVPAMKKKRRSMGWMIFFMIFIGVASLFGLAHFTGLF